jgi:hypothetical protein
MVAGRFFQGRDVGAGIAIGAYWHDFFGGYIPVLMIVAVVGLGYVTYVWAKQ